MRMESKRGEFRDRSSADD